jgi:hypothetical protein
MKNPLTLTAIVCLAMLPASTDARQRLTDAQKLEKALAGRVAGKPQSCLSLRDVHGTERLGDTILYKTASRRTIYRMDTAGGCDSNSSDAIITRTFGGDRLCQGDIIRTADLISGFQSGSCAAAKFVPYSLPRTK